VNRRETVVAAGREHLRKRLPRAVLRRLRPRSTPVPDRVSFGDFRRTRPISSHFGFERGQPVDRYYIERFLERHRADVRGRVLEVGDASYTRRFGGDRVTRSDVLHVHEGSPLATVVADLADAGHIPSDSFDCIILTQTLHLVFDVHAAVATLHRILAPGGVLLATVPGISQIDRGEWGETWFWSFTRQSARRTFEMRFAPADVAVDQYGNVLAAIAFLEGLAGHELEEHELAVTDPAYPVCVAVRAVKGGER
jgi:SAM-dependent methyltransferase